MKADIHLQTTNGLNCLPIPALKGHLNLSKKVVDKPDFDVHFEDNDGCTAIHHSTRICNYDLVEFFLSIGTDVHKKRMKARTVHIFQHNKDI